MSISINFQLIGVSQRTKDAISKALLEALGSYPRRWHVQFIAGQGDEIWEMRVSGPGVETAEYLDGSLNQHDPEFIVSAVRRIITE